MSHHQGVIMKFAPWLVLICLGLVGCSGSKSAQKVNEETPQIELSDADEFVESPVEEGSANTAEADSADALEASDTDQALADSTETASPEMAADPAVAADSNEMIVEDEGVTVADDSATDTASVSDMAAPAVETATAMEPGTPKQYTVKANETLMLIAFKLYGDYEKWKDLANYNQGILKGSTAVRQGMVINYLAPAEEFVWNPQGLPYLIRTGDSLSGISKTVYNNVKKWRLLWDNNRPLIKDPNKIFAGFTIYYIENGREVAAEL